MRKQEFKIVEYKCETYNKYKINPGGDLIGPRGPLFGTIVSRGKETGYKYRRVMLIKDEGGYQMAFIHQLVAQNFIPNPNGHPMVNHIDGNGLNNDIENIEWCTNSHNQKHAIRMGLRTFPTGVNHHFSKLKECDVLDAVQMIKNGFSISDIASKYSVHRLTISKILNGNRYKEIKREIFDLRQKKIEDSWSDEFKSKIVKLYESKMGSASIATFLKIQKRAVIRFLQSYYNVNSLKELK